MNNLRSEAARLLPITVFAMKPSQPPHLGQVPLQPQPAHAPLTGRLVSHWLPPFLDRKLPEGTCLQHQIGAE